MKIVDKVRNRQRRAAGLCHAASLHFAGCAILFSARAGARAQPGVTSHARGFTSVEYYPVPLQQQMKSRLSGAEAQP